MNKHRLRLKQQSKLLKRLEQHLRLNRHDLLKNKLHNRSKSNKKSKGANQVKSKLHNLRNRNLLLPLCLDLSVYFNLFIG